MSRPDPPPPILDRRLLRRMARWVRPQAPSLLLALLALLGASACRLGLPWLIKLFIDRHLVPGDLAGAAPLAAAFLGLAAGAALLRRVQVLAVERAGQDALLALRREVFHHLQRLSTAFHDRTPAGRLVGRVTTDIEALQEAFSTGLVTILGDLIFLAATLAILLALDVRLTAVTLLAVPVLLLTTLLVRTRARRAYEEVRRLLAALNALLHEQLSGIALVQAFGQEARSLDAFRAENASLRRAQLRSVFWESNLSAAVEMIGSFTIALILGYGGGLVADDVESGRLAAGTGLTLGTLFAFIDYMQRFFGPLNELSLKFTVLQNAGTAARRIQALLDEDDVLPEPDPPAVLPPPQGRLEFRNVSFAYRPGQPVLRNLSFTVAPGERVAVVGATGAGKTTILKLLARLYDVQEGAVLVDGLDVRRWPLPELRRRLGVVTQDVFLFAGDVLENIRLGNPAITREQARAAAEALHLDRVVARFPRGWEEPVAERGRNLSAGEQQLIAFARVLAADPPMLVLDEATSNVDSATEALLQEAVHRLMEGRSSLVIAHRLSTIRDADRILVLHEGRLVEEGSHNALLARRGYYWRLHALQFATAGGGPSSSRP